jgi:hypothetical protein
MLIPCAGQFALFLFAVTKRNTAAFVACRARIPAVDRIHNFMAHVATYHLRFC